MVGNRSNPARRRFRAKDPRDREAPGVGELDYEAPGGDPLDFDNPAEGEALDDTPMGDDAAALAVLEGDPSEFGFDGDGDGELDDGGLGDVGSWMDDPIGGGGDDGGDQGEAPARKPRRKRQALSALAVGVKFTQPNKSAVWEVIGPSAVAGHVRVRLVKGRVAGFGRLGVGRLANNAAVLVQ